MTSLVNLSKIITPFEDNREAVLVGAVVKMLGLVSREWRTDLFEILRLDCCGNVVGNLGSEMLTSI